MIVASLLLALTAVALPRCAQSANHQGGRDDVPASFEQLSAQAEQARNQSRDDDAIRLYRAALSEEPEWQQGLWYLGTLFYDKQRYVDARDTLRHFMALRPDAGPGWALLGMSEFQLREYARALDHLRRAMVLGMGERQDLRQSVFYFAAVLLTRMERFDDSMDMLAKMLGNGQDASLLAEPAGLAGLRLPLLPTEIPSDRKDLVHAAGEAVVALQTQHYEDADAKFKQLVAAYPNEPGVHFLYGAYLMQLHPEDGVREMKRELEISPFHVLARVRLAEQYLTQQQHDEALKLAEEAAKLDPKRASPHMLEGEALQAKGDLAGALEALEVARRLDTLNSRIHWDLLRTYTALGRTADAKHEKDEIEKLSRSDSGSGSAKGDKSSEPTPAK